MWTPQERVFSVLGLDESKYVKRAQRNFRREFNLGRLDDIPSYLSIVNWDILLRETGSLLSTCGNHSKRECVCGNCGKDSYGLRKKSEEVNLTHQCRATVHGS